MLAALATTKLPFASYDEESEQILCSPDPALYKTLHVGARGKRRGKGQGMPIVESFAVFLADGEEREEEGGGQGAMTKQTKQTKQTGRRNKKGRAFILIDPDAFEEDLCEEVVTIAVGEGGQISRIEKGGGGVIGVEEMSECVRLAGEGRDEVVKIIHGGGRGGDQEAKGKGKGRAEER